MEKEYTNLCEIEKDIKECTLELSKYDKKDPREFVMYDTLCKRLEELKRIKYDFIYGTHTNEIHHYLNKLKSAKMRYALAYRGKKHIWQTQINIFEDKIEELKEMDKQKTLVRRKSL